MMLSVLRRWCVSARVVSESTRSMISRTGTVRSTACTSFLGDYKYWTMRECTDIDLQVSDEVLNRALLYRDRRDFVIRAGDTGIREESEKDEPMTETSEPDTLLAHLARKLSDRHEDIAVEALGYIFQSSPARRVLEEMLRGGGADVGSIEEVQTQATRERRRAAGSRRRRSGWPGTCADRGEVLGRAHRKSAGGLP